MNILVTGSGGFVGSNVCKHLIKKDNSVIGIYNKNKNDIAHKKIKLDLCKELDSHKIKKFFSNKRIDIIIHLAAELADKKNILDFKLFHNNIKITKNVIKIANHLKPKKFINFSSMAVYPNDVNGSFDEKYKFSLNSNSDFLYGLSKYCSEILFEKLINKYNKINLIHLRISQIYGKGMDKTRVIPAMKKELKSKNSITVFGEGIRTSNFIHIEKLLIYLDLILKRKMNGIYNIGDQNISYLNLAKKIIKDEGNGKSVIIKVKKGSRGKFILNTNKFDKVLNK